MKYFGKILYSALFVLSVTVAGVMSMPAYESFRTNDADLVKGQLAKEYEEHFNKSHPIKAFGTGLWAAIQYELFKEGRPGVVVGRDEWLFTDEELVHYPDFEKRISERIALINDIKVYLKNFDVEMIVALIPAKTRIYEEKLPKRYSSYYQPDDASHSLFVALAHSKLSIEDLTQALLLAKVEHTAFLKTDTHWSQQGAKYAAAQLIRTMKRNYPELSWGEDHFETRVERNQDHKGDLLNYIPLGSYFEKLGPAADVISVTSTNLIEQSIGDLDMFGDAGSEIVLVGTSYSANTLWNFAGFLREEAELDILNVAEEGKGPVIPMLEYLVSEDFLESPPRVVIWEIPERYFPMEYEMNAYNLPFISRYYVSNTEPINTK